MVIRMKLRLKWKSGNLFKIISAVVVILFVLMVAGGVFKFFHYRSSFTTMNEAQIQSVQELVMQDMHTRGKNSTDYSIKVIPKIRMMKKNSISQSLVQVSLSNEQEHGFYLLDLNTNKILLYSETYMYEKINDECNSQHGRQEKNESKENEENIEWNSRWFHRGLMIDKSRCTLRS